MRVLGAQAGVSFISGVDSGINPVKRHGLLPTAIVELVTAGVPPVTALASATSQAARACGLADRTGRLRTGLHADLLLVDGDPTTDITAIRDTRMILSRGRATRPGPDRQLADDHSSNGIRKVTVVLDAQRSASSPTRPGRRCAKANDP